MCILFLLWGPARDVFFSRDSIHGIYNNSVHSSDTQTHTNRNIIRYQSTMKLRITSSLLFAVSIFVAISQVCDGMPAPPCPDNAPLVSDLILPNGRQCTQCTDPSKTQGGDCTIKCTCEDSECDDRVCTTQPADCGVLNCDVIPFGTPFPLEAGCKDVCPDREPEMFSQCDADAVGTCNCPTSDSFCAFNCLGGQWVMLCAGGGGGGGVAPPKQTPPPPAQPPAPFPLPTNCIDVCSPARPDFGVMCDVDAVGGCLCPSGDVDCSWDCLSDGVEGQWQLRCGSGFPPPPAPRPATESSRASALAPILSVSVVVSSMALLW